MKVGECCDKFRTVQTNKTLSFLKISIHSIIKISKYVLSAKQGSDQIFNWWQFDSSINDTE